jgi:hypothetical protein
MRAFIPGKGARRLVTDLPRWQPEAMTDVQRKLLQAVVRDGLKIQPRFSSAPVYAVTGGGSLKSEGVATLQRIKRNLKKRDGD